MQVVNVNEFDDQGIVFGRPDQIELDVITHNGLLILCELRSSIDKAGMYIFERKARFYEQRHQCTANRLIVISSMIEPKARAVAERLGIETYGDSSDVATLWWGLSPSIRPIQGVRGAGVLPAPWRRGLSDD